MEQTSYGDNATLLEKSLAGDEGATEALVVNNAALVRSIALRHVGRGTDLEDLIQIGNIGLLKAIRTFDLGRGCAFSTYAVPLIFGEIRRHLRDDGFLKVSRSQKQLAAKLCALKEEAAKAGRELRMRELAEAVGVTEAEAATALEAVSPVRSLSESLFGEEDGLTLDAAITDEEEGERNFDRLALSMAVEKLPPLRRKIVLLRYWRDLSQQQTADLLGLTQVKVSREEKKILEALRRDMT